jgi:hypothetical protein
MKPITKNGCKKLGNETAKMIRGMRGAAAQIAAIGKLDHAYVSRVLAGKKPASKRFLLALDYVLQGAQACVRSAILHHEHPEIDDGPLVEKQIQRHKD